MKPWLVKIKRYDGSESIVDTVDTEDEAMEIACARNEYYQAELFYVEAYDEAKLLGFG